jgi:hypothetical protein
MVRTLGYSVFLFFLALSAVELTVMPTASDFLGLWPSDPLHAHDQLPVAADGQTETDQGEGELELALPQGEAFRIIHLARARTQDSASRPRTNFVSDLFRPPTRS